MAADAIGVTEHIQAPTLAFNATQSTHNRRRGDHSTCVKNVSPDYQVPANHTNRLVFIKDLFDKAASMDITKSDEFVHGRWTYHYQKAMYSDRRKAINALKLVICEHIDLLTSQVKISIKNAAIAAGLSTISDAEKAKQEADPNHIPVISISRASRAIRDMVNLGWIKAPKEWQVWDKERGEWLDKYFEVTDLFYNAVGFTTERVEKARNSRLGYLKKKALAAGKSVEEVSRMTLTQIKGETRKLWRKSVFERRASERAKRKLKEDLSNKTRQEQRSIASKRVIKRLNDDGISFVNVSKADFTELVNREIASIRKFADVEPPT